MKLAIVSVRDRAAMAFGRPVFTASEGVAIRSFTDEVNRPSADNDMNKHPGDFDLYCFGVFDDEMGEFSLETTPRLLLKGDQAFVKE